MSDTLVNLLGIAAIAGIVWWFWLSRPSARRAASDARSPIIVDGGVYTPGDIEIPAHEARVLRFLRRDPSPCAERLIFDDLNVSADLALGEVTEIHVPATPSGVYAFHCQMGMYRGRLLVTSAENGQSGD